MTKAEILGVLDKQVIAWNRGDIDNFMMGYWQSDSMLFVGKNGITQGWQATLDRYKKNYPGKEGMGTLAFEILRFEMLDPDVALVIGKWTLQRGMPDKPETLGGHYSLLFKRKQGRWKIVLDHTS